MSTPTELETGAESTRLGAVDRKMRAAVADGVFPGAVLLASRGGRIFHRQAYGLADLDAGGETTLQTVYDLASLTKPLATALAVLKLVAAGAIDLDARLGDLLPAFARSAKSDIQIRHLLCHTAGLAAWRPFYRSLEALPTGARRDALHSYLVQERLVDRIGENCRYSDIGFMILHRVVEDVSGERLDRFVRRHIYRPLGVEDLFYIPLSEPRPRRSFAATERCPWRGRLLVGEVHDENAHSIGGVAGHSGLFGTADAVHALLRALIDAYGGRAVDQPLPRDLLRQAFAKCPRGPRSLGFDRPDPVDSSSGGRFSADSVGHLGYTGTSFWIDLTRRIVVILLSNRVHPSRANDAIKAFRPLLHDAVMSALLDADA